ncbi:MAG: hypothetical protein IT215_06475 [Chitinophagaceae bacterium]|nr:hypothetical protein [Chitinophagaceae bacterium]
MFSFLPEEYKKEVKSEYKKRFLIALFSFISLSLLILFLLLIFSYYISKIQYESVNQQYDLIKSSQAYKNRDKLESDLNQTKTNLAKIKDLSDFSIYDLFNKILSYKNSQIKITNIQYQKTGDERSVLLIGISQNRESLLAYSKIISGDTSFKYVDLPISSYAKDKNIDFQMKLVLNSIK